MYFQWYLAVPQSVVCLQVLSMDVNVSSQVAKMKRDLLKLIGIGEFADSASWRDPCTSFVIPEVFTVLDHDVLR